jgi:hypothetical protein
LVLGIEKAALVPKLIIFAEQIHHGIVKLAAAKPVIAACRRRRFHSKKKSFDYFTHSGKMWLKSKRVMVLWYTWYWEAVVKKFVFFSDLLLPFEMSRGLFFTWRALIFNN